MGMRVVGVLLSIIGASILAIAQTPELKFIADTLVVQADGTYEADPDLAKMTFRIFSQEKELKKAYDAATHSMQRISALAASNACRKKTFRREYSRWHQFTKEIAKSAHARTMCKEK